MTQAMPFPAAGGRSDATGRTLAAAVVALRDRGRLDRLSFLSLVGLGFALNAWHLAHAGLGNTYYAAAVRSMTLSWKNFFFGAFDPGGFITVDKPPVFLWVGALTARIFGYSSLSLLLPSAVAGAAAVALVWLIARRYFGLVAATVAGLVLVLTPISVAVDRLNLPEPFYVLALTGAAYAVLRSIESRRWWAWIALAGALVGIAFNTKMLAAWIPGPALALAIVVGVRAEWRSVWKQWLPRLALLAAVTFAVSASWMLVVDVWPASSRPYVGGSTDNTETNLIVGYNGFGRVDGNEAGRGGPGGAPPAGATNRTAGRNVPQARNNPAQGPGGIIAGAPGLFRMFDPANGGQIAWFLPFALLGGVVAFWRWRREPVQLAAVVLFAGWVLLFGGVFSYMKGIYHSYYTSAMAPGIAVLAGIAVVALADLLRRHPAWFAAVIGVAAVTVWVQLTLAGRFTGYYDWLRPYTVGVVVAGLILASGAIWGRLPALPGLALIVAGLLLLPGGWATSEAANASLNTTLPQAGPREGAAGRTFGSNAFDSGSPQLASWLKANQDPNARWDLVVQSAQNASSLIAQDQLSVMALGGFLGSDPTITVKDFAELVAAGEVRYVMAGGAGAGGPGGGFTQPRGGFTPPTTNSGRGGLAIPNTRIPGAQAQTTPQAGATPVMSAVRSACTPVTSSSLPAADRGSLYDCSGQAPALSALG